MSTINFTITDRSTNAVIGQGVFVVEDASSKVTDVSGFINNEPITGATTFDGSDNLIKQYIAPFRSSYSSSNGADENGIAFKTATKNYNIKSTPDSFYFYQTTEQYSDDLDDSNDNVDIVNLDAGGYFEAGACYVSGTAIGTFHGEAAVEDLQVGEMAMTASGRVRSIVWIGSRDIDCWGRHDLYPIRVSAHAFGVGLPKRDLYLSPGHPVLVGSDADKKGGVLVPIMCLVNGTTIERVPVDHVTYWHVELDQHDILLAEGLPAESYIDLGSRPWFDGAESALYNPDLALPGMLARCRPVVTEGPIVEAERRRLDTVFAARLADACAWPSAGDSMVEKIDSL